MRLKTVKNRQGRHSKKTKKRGGEVAFMDGDIIF